MRWSRPPAVPAPVGDAVQSSLVSGTNRRVLLALLCGPLLLLSVACTSSGTGARSSGSSSGSSNGSSAGGSIPRDRVSFADVDDEMNARVRDDHLDGAAILTVRDGRVLQQQFYGSYGADTVVPIASASKWLTSATVMTLVDEGKLSLDDPVATYLPDWNGDKATITIRQLLSHHAGLDSSASCLGQSSITLEACVASIAKQPLAYPPGTQFHYGNVGYSVAARVIEVVTGQEFEQAFEARIAQPVGMTHTTFPSISGTPTKNPMPAASGRSTLDDYARFVSMMLAEGSIDGRRVLSAGAVGEIERNQVEGLDTYDDFAVQITGFPTYGLGVWRDRSAADGTAVMVSGSGSVGFYPWLDRERHAYGVVLVDDDAGSSGHAVRRSTATVHDLVLPALDNTPR